MDIFCLGLNHPTADIKFREQLVLDESDYAQVYRRMRSYPTDSPAVEELVVLSTCNRVEFYAVGARGTIPKLEDLLIDLSAVERKKLHSHLYQLQGDQAVQHLMHVACGLDSMVLGEPQILGQVKDAYQHAVELEAVGKMLEKLFHAALHAGKRARAETRISHNPASISSQAVELAASVVSSIKRSTVAILGAGEMAELALQALVKRGVNEILVMNRTLERARELADQWQGEAHTFENMPEILTRADILISSTAAPHTLIHRTAVEKIIPQRSGRPLVILDIAVPRDVQEDVDLVKGVSLYDIDQIHGLLENSLQERKAEIPRVEKIIAEEVDRFHEFTKTLAVRPVIRDLHQYLEEIRQDALTQTLCHCQSLCEEDQERIETMTKAMVNRFLHQPIYQLKKEAGSEKGARYAGLCRTLFGLNGEPAIKDPEGGEA